MFKEEDVVIARKFGQFLSAKAKFELSIPESIELNKSLVWYNGLIKKVEDHIFEITRITKAKEDKKKAKK